MVDNHSHNVTSNITLPHFDDSFVNLNYLAYVVSGTFERAPFGNNLRACLDRHEMLKSLIEGASGLNIDEDSQRVQLPVSHFLCYKTEPTIAYAPFPNNISANGCSSNTSN